MGGDMSKEALEGRPTRIFEVDTRFDPARRIPPPPDDAPQWFGTQEDKQQELQTLEKERSVRPRTAFTIEPYIDWLIGQWRQLNREDIERFIAIRFLARKWMEDPVEWKAYFLCWDKDPGLAAQNAAKRLASKSGGTEDEAEASEAAQGGLKMPEGLEGAGTEGGVDKTRSGVVYVPREWEALVPVKDDFQKAWNALVWLDQAMKKKYEREQKQNMSEDGGAEGGGLEGNEGSEFLSVEF
ncbi:hypothetical protein CC80DRAFT_576977 [Byssothecium circinans]|uniref:Uncharacterized protein n=1 Tax=Byssothecium circinans TaxID=147558 RepID=A0A6A5TCY4_9PLEO|nr:hypothetical protein CC80DRAFT_576977 [Byssothecium circinans]